MLDDIIHMRPCNRENSAISVDKQECVARIANDVMYVLFVWHRLEDPCAANVKVVKR